MNNLPSGLNDEQIKDNIVKNKANPKITMIIAWEFPSKY